MLTPFLSDVVEFTLLAAYSYYTATYPYFKDFPTMGSCAGTETAAIFACGLLSSYLVLFVQSYISTYRKPSKGKKPIANGKPIMNGNDVANGNGIANGHGCVLHPIITGSY